MDYFETSAGHALGSVLNEYFSGLAFGEETAVTIKKDTFARDLNDYLAKGYHFCLSIDNIPNDSFCTVILRRPV